MRLIDADAYEYPGDLVDMPTIDAEPVRHGRWIDGMKCSECPQVDTTKPNYCPNCGAKMNEGSPHNVGQTTGGAGDENA